MRATLFAVLAVAACARAGDPTERAVDASGGGDASHHVDAPGGVPIDGPSGHHDAAVVVHDAMPDAFVSHSPDADTTGSLCTANDQCTTTGDCCVTLGGSQGFCEPGTVVGGNCFPQ